MKPRVAVTHRVHPEVTALLERHCEISANPGRETLENILQALKGEAPRDAVNHPIGSRKLSRCL